MTSTNAMLSKYRNLVNNNNTNKNSSNKTIQNEPEIGKDEKKKDDKINDEKPFDELPKNRPTISNLLQKFEKKASNESCGIGKENLNNLNKNDGNYFNDDNENNERVYRKSAITSKMNICGIKRASSDNSYKFNEKDNINKEKESLIVLPLIKHNSIQEKKNELLNAMFELNKPLNETKNESCDIPEIKERKSVIDLIKLNEKRLKESTHRSSSSQKDVNKLHINFEEIDRSKYRNTMADNFTKVSEIKYFLKLLKNEKTDNLNDEDSVHVKELINYYENKLQTRPKTCLKISKERNTTDNLFFKYGNNLKVSVIKEEEEDENSKYSSRKNIFKYKADLKIKKEANDKVSDKSLSM